MLIYDWHINEKNKPTKTTTTTKEQQQQQQQPTIPHFGASWTYFKNQGIELFPFLSSW